MTTIAPSPMFAPPPTLAESLDHLVCVNFKHKEWKRLRDVTSWWLEDFVKAGKIAEQYPYLWDQARVGQMAALVLKHRKAGGL